MRPAMRAARKRQNEKAELKRAILVVKKKIAGCTVLKPVNVWPRWDEVTCLNCGAEFEEFLGECALCGKKR